MKTMRLYLAAMMLAGVLRADVVGEPPGIAGEPKNTGGKITAINDADVKFIRLVEAALMGDAAVVKEMIDAAAEINREDGNNLTPLMHAADAGQLETARLLLAASADPKAITPFADSSLEFAIASGNTALVKLLLDSGAELRPQPARDSEWPVRSPLTVALQWDHVEAVQLLVARGLALDPYPDQRQTRNALTIAASQGSVGCLEYLLRQGLNPNQADRGGNLPLGVAALNGHGEIVRLLVNAGADVNGISRGQPPIKNWTPLPLTPLAAAVIGNRSEIVKFLLGNGADPRLLEDAAGKFADLTGNQEVYAMLRSAGAAEIAPYSFLDLKKLSDPGWLDDADQRAGAQVRPWNIEAILTHRPAETAPTALERELKIAIIPSDPGLEDMASLLVAVISKLENAVVLDREQLRRLLADRNLAKMGSEGAAERVRWGKILGADVLIFLRRHNFEKGQLDEAQVVETRTGLNLGAAYARKDAGNFAAAVIGNVHRAAAALAADPAKALLISIPRLTATSTTGAAREAERELGLLISFLLARQPNVFLLDRKEMDRLALEKDLGEETRAFLNSSAVLDGSLDLPNDLERDPVTLRLRVKPGGAGEPREITVSGSYRAPLPFLEKAVSEVIAALDRDAATSGWDAASEARLYFEEAKWFHQSRIWDQALAGAEAAWALGLRTDEVLKLRLSSLYHRLLWSYNLAVVEKGKRLEGQLNVMLRWAPLLFPRKHDKELAAEEYIDLANRLLDAMNAILVRARSDYAGQRSLLLFSSDAMKAATLPLDLLEPLSAQREYQVDLDGLRARLLTFHKDLLEQAAKNKDAEMAHACHFNYFRNGAHWEPRVFEQQVNQTVEAALAEGAFISPHAVLAALVLVAKPHLNLIAGRANTVWSRLARKWKASQDPRFEYLGWCLHARDVAGLAAKGRAMPRVIELFHQLHARDTALPGWGPQEQEINERLGLKSETRLHTSWLGEGLKTLMAWRIHAGPQAKGQYREVWTVLQPQRNFVGSQRLLPSWRRFNYENTSVALRRIAERGAGSFPHFTWFNVGFTVGELRELLQSSEAARTAAENFADKEPKFRELWADCNRLCNTLESALAELGAQSPDEEFVIELKNRHIPVLEIGLQRSEQERERFGEQGAVAATVFGGHLYIQTLGAGVIELAADGRVVGSIPFPEGYSSLRTGEDRDVAINGRYFATPLTRLDDKHHPQKIALYDRTARSWKLLPYAASRNNVLPLIILGDQIAYSFVYNPRTQDPIESHAIMKDPETIRGLMMINAKTGQETLLASSRREPKASPLDGPRQKPYSLRKLTESTFLSEGHVYDLKAGEWRKAEPPILEAMRRQDEQVRHISGLGTQWKPYFHRGRGIAFRGLLTKEPGGPAKLTEIVVQLKFESPPVELAGWTWLNTIYKKPPLEDLNVFMTEPFVVLSNGLGYFVIPRAEVESALKEAFERGNVKTF